MIRNERPDVSAQPLVSIIIPTFNAALTISGALQSIFRQRFELFEILVIDGESSDDTAIIVSQFQKRYKNVHFFCEADKGTFDAMNKSIVRASGEWLLFLGADDELHDPDVLEDMSRMLHQVDYDIVYGDVITIGNTPFAGNGIIYGGEFSKERIVTRNICHQSIFYRKTVFERIGNYNIEYKICADWDLNQRCFASLNTSYVPRVVAKFLAGGQSSGKLDRFSEFDRSANSARYFKISYFHRSFEGDVTFFINLSKHFLRAGRFHKAIFYLVIAIYQGRLKLLRLRQGYRSTCVGCAPAGPLQAAASERRRAFFTLKAVKINTPCTSARPKNTAR